MQGKVKREAEAFWEQAEDFYWAAEESSSSAKPLLYYYSFMNMVKAFLILRGRSLKATEQHGILYPRPAKSRSQLHTQELVVRHGSSTVTSVFHDFAAQLGVTLPDNRVMRVGDLLGQIVGIHRAWMSVTRNDSRFALAQVGLRKQPESQEVFALLSFLSREKRLAEAIASKNGWRRVQSDKTDEVYFETKMVRRLGRSYQPAVERLTNDLVSRGMHLLLTEHEGYRIYFSHFGHRETARLPQLVSLYAVMFFLGAITRYRPYDFDRFVEGKWGWLVNEFINSQPPQFIYLLTSEMVKNEVVLPLGRVEITAV